MAFSGITQFLNTAGCTVFDVSEISSAYALLGTKYKFP